MWYLHVKFTRSLAFTISGTDISVNWIPATVMGEDRKEKERGIWLIVRLELFGGECGNVR